jgi:chaperonin GroEL
LRTGGGGGGDRLRGGVALLRAAKALDHLTLSGDETTGVNIVRRALEEPIRRIVENASFEGSVVVKKVKAASTPPQGFDAERNEYVDLMKAGIVDPTKVERIALQNAASIASDDRGADHGHPSEGASHAGHAAPVVA